WFLTLSSPLDESEGGQETARSTLARSEKFAISPIEIKQKRGGKLLPVHLSIQRDGQGNGVRSQFFRKIFQRLIHVNSDSRDGEVWRMFLSAHFHQHARDFFSLDTNIVWQLDGGCESKFLLDCFGNSLRGPRGQSRRFADVDHRAQQN